MSLFPLVGRPEALLDDRQTAHQRPSTSGSLCSLRAKRREHRPYPGSLPRIQTAVVDASLCHPMNEVSFHLWLCESRERIAQPLRVFNQSSGTWTEIARGMAKEARLWRLANAAMPALRL
uniref:Uncharacterized protein n=1 Tax=Oryza meridionalis TaxID=40149 RepID=A0A0E0DTH6_9ORYZ